MNNDCKVFFVNPSYIPFNDSHELVWHDIPVCLCKHDIGHDTIDIGILAPIADA